MTTAVYVVEVDWDDDGTYGNAESDVTADVIDAAWGLGRDRPSQLEGGSVAGTLQVRLNNFTGKYSSFNTSSAIFGLIKPGRLVRIRSTSPSAATLWTGYLASIQPTPAFGGVHRAVLRAEGPLSQISQAIARVAQTASVLTGAAVDDVLDSVDWAAGARDIATGQTTMSRWWADKRALQALREIEETEGGFIRESRAGEIVFEDRYTRLAEPHTVSQATYSDASGAAISYRRVRQADPIQGVYNRIRARVTPYTVGALATLWTLSETTAPSIQPGETAVYWAEYPVADSPTEAIGVDAWTTPVEDTDYDANSQAGGGGTDLSSDLTVSVSKFSNTMKISITNGAAVPAYLTLLQARGTPLSRGDVITVSAEDSDSIDDYGEREYPLEAPFIPDTNEARDNCNFKLGIYKSENPVLTVTQLANRDANTMADALAREVSDRVTVVATGNAGMGINDDFFIEGVRHTVDRRRIHRVTYELSPAGGYTGFWVTDVSKLGKETKLAY